jgi:hypothetical protein
MNLSRLPFRFVLLLGCFARMTRLALGQVPATPVGTTSAVQTATLTFTEAATVASIHVLTQGAPNLDFQVASGGTCAVGTAYSVGQTCTVKFTFAPTHPGPRYGAVVLYDNASPANAAATAYIQGTGNGPQIVYSPASSVELGSGFIKVGGLAVDGAGNIFVADILGNAVKEIVAAGGYTNILSLPSDGESLAVDGAGNIFAGDLFGFTVKEIVAASGYTRVVTVVSNVQAEAIAVDGSGDLFIVDEAYSAIVEATFASGYTAEQQVCGRPLYGCTPHDLTVDGNGNIFIADTESHRVREITAASGYTKIIGIGPTFQGAGQEGYAPGGVALDQNDNVFVTYNASGGYQSIDEIFAQGGYTNFAPITSFPAMQESVVTALHPATDGAGNLYTLNVVDGAIGVEKFVFGDPPSRAFAATAGGATSSDRPQTVTVTNDGNEPLQFSGLSYPPDFPEASGVDTDCTSSTSLAADTSCTLAIDFSPLGSSATGLSTPLNEQVSLTDNNLNVADAEQDVSVSGTETFTPPAVTTPAPGTMLGSSSETFSWSPGSATSFQFRLGTVLGANDIYGSGKTSKISESVSDVPTGVNVYARLYYTLDGSWQYLDYTYPGAPTAPSLTTPTPGTTLSGSTVTFSWNPGSATTFKFQLGSYTGGNGLYGSGQTTKTSETVSGLPVNGETIHARLSYLAGGVWQSIDYVYTAK